MGEETARQLQVEDICDPVSQREIRAQTKKCLIFVKFCVFITDSLSSSVCMYVVHITVCGGSSLALCQCKLS